MARKTHPLARLLRVTLTACALAGAAAPVLLAGFLVVEWVRSQWRSDTFTYSWISHSPDTFANGVVAVSFHPRGVLAWSSVWLDDDPAAAADLRRWNPPTRRFESRPADRPVPLQGVGVSPPGGSQFRWGGFEYAHARRLGYYRMDFLGPTPHRMPPERRWVARAPYWGLLLVLLTPTLGAVWLARGHRRRGARRRAGQCVGCGYDLRATPARCPECGRAAES